MHDGRSTRWTERDTLQDMLATKIKIVGGWDKVQPSGALPSEDGGWSRRRGMTNADGSYSGAGAYETATVR